MKVTLAFLGVFVVVFCSLQTTILASPFDDIWACRGFPPAPGCPFYDIWNKFAGGNNGSGSGNGTVPAGSPAGGAATNATAATAAAKPDAAAPPAATRSLGPLPLPVDLPVTLPRLIR